MGTMINSSKITDFYIAGMKINGFAKNGQIVFKQEKSGDTTPPKYNKIQIYNKDNTSQTTVTNGVTIRVLATFSEELENNPILTIGNQSAELNKISDDNIYQVDLPLMGNNLLEEGILKFTISGYTDLAGNVGDVITEAEASNSLTYVLPNDRIAPTITVKTGDNETIGNEIDGYSKIRFKIYDNVALLEYEINGTVNKLSASQWRRYK